MTILRRITVGIAGKVAEFAAPGQKDWARASASEVEEIAGDWAALAWAVGSVRLVFQRAETEEGSGQSFPISLSFQTLIWLSQIFVACLSMATAKSLPERIGWGLVAFGWSYWCSASIVDRLRERNAPPWSDVHASRVYRLEQLQRRLRRYRSVWRWSSPLVTICTLYGLIITLGGFEQSPIFASLVVAGGGLAIWTQFLETPEKIQGRIDRLEEQMAEKAVEQDFAR